MGAVAPNVLAVTIEAGELIRGKQRPYRERQGDEIYKKKGRKELWLRRDGKIIGTFVGEKQEILWPVDQILGEQLDTSWVTQTKNLRITSADDKSFAGGIHPNVIHRKSKPHGMAIAGPDDYRYVMRHTLFLQLPFHLQDGSSYSISFAGKRLGSRIYKHIPRDHRSEAVHVNQLGFHVRSKAKIAFLRRPRGYEPRILCLLKHYY